MLGPRPCRRAATAAFLALESAKTNGGAAAGGNRLPERVILLRFQLNFI